MRIDVSERLAGLLADAGRDDLLGGFDVDADFYSEHAAQVAASHPQASLDDLKLLTGYSIALHANAAHNRKEAAKEPMVQAPVPIPAPAPPAPSQLVHWVQVAILIALLLAMCVKGKAQGTGGIILRGQQSGVTQFTRAGGLITLNCSTGLTCSFTSGVWTITASGSSIPYPGAGIPCSTGSAWCTSYGTTGSGTSVVLATSPTVTTPAITGAATESNNGIGTAVAAGYTAQNTTAAAAGAQQYSPCILLSGQGWNTASLASQAADWCVQVIPSQGNPITSKLEFYYRINGGTWTEAANLVNNGSFFSAGSIVTAGTIQTTGGSVVSNRGNPGAFQLTAAGGGIEFQTTGGSTPPTGGPCWNGATQFTEDTCLRRNAAGVVEVDTGSAGAFGELKLRHALAAGTAPTITSGFGTSPAIAGADGAGRLTVGTGGTATTGVVTFGTAWTTAPACVTNDESTIKLVQATATTTTLTLTASAAFTASDLLTWHCTGY